MTAAPDEISPFPAPVRLDGYIGWAWRLFRSCFWRLIGLFMGGLVLAALLDMGVVYLIVEVFDGEGTVEGYATSLAARIVFWTVFGTFLAAVGSVVFLHQVAGRRVGADSGWRRTRPRFGHVVVSALYVSMPLLMLVLFLGPIAQYFLLPALLGPPVLVHALVWEQLSFRDAAVRAKNLLSGHWLRVTGAIFVLTLGAALLQNLVLVLVSTLLPEIQDLDLADSIWSIVTLVVTSAVVWVFTAAAGTVAYLELRARFEELDGGGLEAEALEPAS